MSESQGGTAPNNLPTAAAPGGQKVAGAPARALSAVSAVPAVLLVLVSLWEVVATRCDATSVPGDDAWAEAATAVRAGYRPGDLIVFAPDWVDPVGRLHLGDLISIDMAARMDAARYGRIWEVAIRGAHAPDTAGLEPVATEDHGGVEIRRYEREPAEVVSDVRDALGTATVDGGGRPTLELAEVGFAPHRCLQASPAPGKPLRIMFPRLALGGDLVGYVGIADVFNRRDNRAAAHLDVEVDGKRAVSAEASVDDGWVRFAIPTKSGPADVTFVLSSDKPDRRICFAAEARR
jgi:hypothetical protein